MRIKMKSQISGTRNGLPWPAPGETVDLPDVEAMKYCANGQATPVPEDRTERAVAAEPEKRRPGRPRKNPA